jgi:hypothetical protein
VDYNTNEFVFGSLGLSQAFAAKEQGALGE